MIDYFIHFIDKPFHLLLGNAAPSVHHRPYLTDECGNFPRLHTRLPGNPAERALILCHFPHIHLYFSPQFLRKIEKLLADQVCMVFLLIIKAHVKLKVVLLLETQNLHFVYKVLQFLVETRPIKHKQLQSQAIHHWCSLTRYRKGLFWIFTVSEMVF